MRPDKPHGRREPAGALSRRVALWLTVALLAAVVPWVLLRVAFGQMWWALGGLLVTVLLLAWLWSQPKR